MSEIKTNTQNQTNHCCCIHDDIVQSVAKNLNTNEELTSSAELFSVFADFTRLKIVNALLLHEMCVCDIATLLKMSHSSISHQLSVLKLSHIVSARKDGKVKYYSLSDEHISELFKLALEHINE
ncbi:MAG: metalloregulator ArsR/SmtB family transcription factor [Clostridia bacterium]|nr:metalloregulator ArsR/SmtB family transcription factor [Clostridia bacterium]